MKNDEKKTPTPEGDAARTKLTLRRETIATLRVRTGMRTGPGPGVTNPNPGCLPSATVWQGGG
jgi:hypothetical protein